jgi:glucokinase
MAKDKSAQYWVGFDLGGTKMLSTVFDGKFKALGRERKKTKSQKGQKAGLERIVRTIQDALDQAGVRASDLGAIGVGSPGPLDTERGIILDTPNLGWKNAPIRDTIEQAFGCPAVVINDVDAGVYGEYRFGAAAGARCAVGVFPGTGIGGGCVYEGLIVQGRTLSAMEIGHMTVLPDGPLCGCGRRGCLEAVASRLAISAACAAAAFRGEAPHLLEAAGTDLANIRSGVLSQSIAAGDKAVEEIIRGAGRAIGRTVAGIVGLLAPEVILLGGGLVEAMPEIFIEEVTAGVDGSVMAPFVGTYKVVAAELGDDATVTGAAAWARARVEPGTD